MVQGKREKAKERGSAARDIIKIFYGCLVIYSLLVHRRSGHRQILAHFVNEAPKLLECILAKRMEQRPASVPNFFFTRCRPPAAPDNDDDDSSGSGGYSEVFLSLMLCSSRAGMT